MTMFDESVERHRLVERRQLARQERVSWASTQPYLPLRREGALLDPAALADQRRGRWARPLIVKQLIGEALGAAVLTWLVSSTLGSSEAHMVGASVLAALGWPVLLWLNRAYDSRLIGQGPDEFQALLRCTGLAIALLGLTAYLAHYQVPRRYAIVGIPALGALTGVLRYGLRQGLHHRRARGEDVLRTLVVGDPSATDLVVRDLERASHHGYSVVGVCVPGELAELELDDGMTVFGTFSDVPQAVVDHEIDVVIVAGSGLAGASLRRLSWALERTGAELVIAPGLVEVTGPRLQMRPTAGLSLLHVEAANKRTGRLLGKWVLDRTLGMVLFVAALPVIVLSALLVMATSPGGPLFRQTRIGRDGRAFTMWKIRTMTRDADKRMHEVLAHSDRDGLMFKMHQDPRVTGVGRVLRRLSFDELPQLWNVVTGSMSLVGPRPPLPSEYGKYHDQVHRRLRVKPGITGLWQVSGRADLSWDESIRLDLRYVDNWSMALDLQILWKTARAVVTGSGAY